MRISPLLRSTGYLSAALLLTIATSGDTFAGNDSKKKIELESMGARAFGGTTIPMPDDPTNFQACGHGFVEWFFPTKSRKHPMVLSHGSSTRSYQTTFDGQPGFQSIFLADGYPVYLVDLPWTGRAGKACEEYIWSPVNPTFSARFVWTNRVGTWPVNSTNRQPFPGVKFSNDPKVLDQYFRNQYVEFNAATNNERESTALALLLEEVYKERGKKAILHTHSSSHARGLLTPRKTDKLAGQIGWEPSAAPVFPAGELPPPIPRADGVSVAAGTEIPLAEFRAAYTKHPILLIWGDFIAKTLDPANAGLPTESRRILVEQYRLFALAVNKYGGDVTNINLPDVGVRGNTHYPMADTNITQVSRVVSQWLKQKGLDRDGGGGRHDDDDDDHHH